MEERVEVAVIGGGLSGLFTAVELDRRGVEVVVIDAGAAPGGVARTMETDGYSIEPAAGAVPLPHPHLTPLLTGAGVEVRPAVDASLRHVHTGDRLIAVPGSPKAVLASVVPWSAKLRAAVEPLVRTPPIAADETVATFLRRRFGYRSGAMLAMLMAGGVYAGDPERLSVSAAFPALAALEEAAGSVVRGGLRRRRQAAGEARPSTHLPVGGMGVLARTLADHLGEAYRPGISAAAVRPAGGGWAIEGDMAIHADQVVVTVDPFRAGGLLGGELAETLAMAKAAPVAVVALGGKEGAIPPGFGYLCGPGVGAAVVGCLFESSYAPQRAPAGHWLLKVIAGGRRHPEVIGWDDDRLVARVTAELNQALGSGLVPEMTRVIRHHPGIPQYEVGHLDWLRTLDGLLAERPGLHLTGWSYRGVGVTHLATDAVRVAEAVESARPR